MPRDYDDRDEDDDRPRRRSRRDDDDDRPRRRSRDEDDDDRPRRKSKAQSKQVSVLGIIALVVGILSLVIGIMPCVGSFAVFLGVPAVILGTIGLILAKKSNGRQGSGMSIAGLSTGVVALILSGVWFFVINRVTTKIEDMRKDGQQRHEQWVKDEEERHRKAAQDIKDGTALSVSAADLDQAYGENRNVAERKYDGKVLEVTGRISRVVRDSPPEITIELRGFEAGTVDCEFKVDPGGQAAAVMAGKQVTIRGRCTGRVGAWVQLKDCVLVR